MKKVYSKKVGGEVFALAPEQLEVFRNAGYQTPAPEEVIADAGAAMLTPPEDKRAYVVLNLKSASSPSGCARVPSRGANIAPSSGKSCKRAS